MNVTLAQLTAKVGDKQANLQLIKSAMKQAHEEHSDLIVFPELFLTGYLMDDKVSDLAEPSTGDSLKTIQKWSEQYDVHTVIGFPEMDQLTGNLYISSALISDQGELVEVYRKTHLFEKEKSFFSSGNEFKVANTALGKLGLMICFDVEFPEIARALKLKGAEMLVVINANMYPYEEYHYVYARSRAMENEIPVAICNQLGKIDDIEFCGDSMLIDWNGKEILRMEKEEAVKTGFASLSTDERELALYYTKNRREDIY